MQDEFHRLTISLTSPATAAEDIAPSDDADLSFATRALYVGRAGTVNAVLLDGHNATFTDMQGGTIYPLRLSRVLASGTTAGGLVGLR